MSAIVDWCTATFAFEQSKITLGELLEDLSTVTGLQLIAEERRARPGYSDGVQIMAVVDNSPVKFAVFAWGGESQRGRAMLDFSGECCGCIDDWDLFRGFLQKLPECRLTRVDLAVDLLEGQYTVDDAVTWHEQGLFNVGGRNPSTRTDGDWLQRYEGRTLYVGKAKNGKGLRCYEKGKQLGDFTSKWVRFEVQFGNRDRILPFDMLTDPTKYFVSAYPALERIVAATGERIKTIETESSIRLGSILKAMQGNYGKWFHVFADAGIDAAELVNEIRIAVMPSRVKASELTSGALRSSARNVFEQWCNVRE